MRHVLTKTEAFFVDVRLLLHKMHSEFILLMVRWKICLFLKTMKKILKVYIRSKNSCIFLMLLLKFMEAFH